MTCAQYVAHPFTDIRFRRSETCVCGRIDEQTWEMEQIGHARMDVHINCTLTD